MVKSLFKSARSGSRAWKKGWKKPIVFFAAVSGACVALTACQGGSDSFSQKQGTEEKTVNVITHDSFALSDESIAEFEKVTGFTLKTSAPGDAGQALNELLLTKDTPKYDAFYGIDNYSISRLLDAGIVGATAADQGWDGGEAAKLADPVAQSDSDAVAVPIDRGDVCMNIDKQWFEKEGVQVPKDFDDLVKPEYKDLTVITNPASSSPGYAMLAATHSLYGSDTDEYWEKLFANGVKVDEGWSDAYYTDFSGAEGKGEYPIVLSYSSSPAESAGATSSLPATCVRQIEYAGVLQGAKNSEGAQAFIDFMMSEDVQSSLPENMYMYPERDGVQLPEQWAKYATLSDQPIDVDAKEATNQREEWVNAWTEIFETHAQ